MPGFNPADDPLSLANRRARRGETAQAPPPPKRSGALGGLGIVLILVTGAALLGFAMYRDATAESSPKYTSAKPYNPANDPFFSDN